MEWVGENLMSNRTHHIAQRDSSPFRTAGFISLPEEVTVFIQSGVSVIVGVVGPDGRARAGRALATRVLASGVIRLMYPTEGNDAIIAAAQKGGPIAATFSAPISHRTIQLKSGTSQTAQLEPEDRISVDHQMDAFAAVLGMLGFPPYFLKSFCDSRSESISVLSFVPQFAFEQTPGPRAGCEL